MFHDRIVSIFQLASERGVMVTSFGDFICSFPLTTRLLRIGFGEFRADRPPVGLFFLFLALRSSFLLAP